MLGGVAGAFRHVPKNAEHAHMFAFIIDEFLIWHVVLPGALINGLYEAVTVPTHSSHRCLHGSFWCDDHTCVEPDIGSRCFIANLALRRAMATILGPTATNERKFTVWSEQGRSLGLDWVTTRGTVTIPISKILKAQLRISKAITSGLVTKKVGIEFTRQPTPHCHLLPTCQSLFPAYSWSRDLYEPQRGRFSGVPVEQFAHDFNPSVHVHIDASNEGLCVVVISLH
ncbi:LOW QUALITY PROTEIN: hypothetical protein PHMEG_00030803 [Phytophthora megakarya]|uniref:Uncharacterized protein n=1 Tax=Phytophthora megakarya TaxID=4795 RepID=A0A225UY20_9STRA|nr:LOW QUALITY PROTEIN: hypothetical protein PHMEG_00030803 [Phytophthora megakarya]